MEDAVRPHRLTVAQYACLEVLVRNPGASAADLARGAFVTRQAGHQVLKKLVDEDLVTQTSHPTLRQRSQLTLTRTGERRRRAAADSVDGVERNIAAALSGDGAARLATLLHAVTDVLDTSQSRDATA